MKDNSRALKQRMGMRIFIVAGTVSLLLIVMLIRLAWLQWLPHGSSTVFGDHFKNESVHQRERGIVLDTGRADFIDRYGKAITGESVTTVAGFPLRSGTWGDPEQLAELASILQTDRETLLAWLSELREPAFWRLPGDKQPYRLSDGQLDVLSKLHLNGVRVLPYRARYIEAFAAKHAIGYISQHPERVDVIYEQQLIEGKMKRSEVIGGAGLEKSLDALLRGIGPTSVLHFTDGVDNALHGLNVRMIRQENPYYPLKVQTTLDLDLQNKLESYLAEQGLKEGAVVVLDAETADIAAMISMPMLNPRHLHLSGSEMINRAIHAVAPGSVFKLVTEAAALEAGAAKPGDTFHCDGEYERYGLSCWKPGGHGTLTLSEALAQSCNVVFATIGERLTAQQLQHTAERLGIGRKVGWSTQERFHPLGKPLRLLEEEEAGRVFAALPQEHDGGLLAQTAIGQRDAAMSPLQAANLVVTLLHGGRVQSPRLVSAIRYANGQRMAALPAQGAPSPHGRIAPATAQALLRGMEAVVAQGTGRAIRHGTWTVAGKSGTAQVTVAGRPRNHQWFAGYGPVQSPRYAVAVLAENRSPGSANQATVLFRGVMELIAAHEQGKVASQARL